VVIDTIYRICMAAVLTGGVYPATGISSTHTIQITTVSPAAQRVVSIGCWYELSDGSGWTFRPEVDIFHVELALYDSATALAAGTTPFEHHQTRTSGLWPDGPENDLGELGFEVSPGVLGDNNQHLYGKPHYRSVRLYGGHLSPDSVYQVSFADSVPSHIWLHPVRPRYFTMSTDILQSSESTLTNPVYGPASVNRTILNPDSTRFEYMELSPDVATGLKDDYPVGDYEQRPGSHGNGDFGWFPGYSLSFRNEGPGSVTVALFVTTGFTGPSGAPSNTLANDTFWKSEEVFITAGDTATVRLDFDNVQGNNLSDNPFPHTAGDQSAPDGTTGAVINVFDRLQVSAVGWEVRSGGGGPANASLVITPGAAAIDPITSVEYEMDMPVRVPRLTNVVPNPFRYTTRVHYTMPRSGHVSIRVYDVRGRLIRTLVNKSVVEGVHITSWNAQDEGGTTVTSGIYFIRLISFGQKAVRKAVVLR
jgi:hypothetical protein